MSKWVPARPEYFVQTGGMHENPHGVPRDEIARMILENPAEVVAQVIFGKYVESSGLVFTADVIQGLFERGGTRILGNGWIDRTAAEQAQTDRRRYEEGGDRFHTGVDFARQTDYTVIFTIDKLATPGRVVYYKRLNRVPWETIYEEVGKARYLWGSNILGDGTGPGGDVVFDALESRQYCHVHHRTPMIGYRCMRDGVELEGCKPENYLPLGVCEPFTFSGPSKKELVEHLRNVLSVGYDAKNPKVGSFGWLRCPSIPQLEEELSFYAWDDKKLETDCLFALALACWSAYEDPQGDPALGSTYGD